MIFNNRKAFSLIEVLQTLVLLGFIAGLSISFFRKLNPDDKIYASTAKMLKEAVQEMSIRVCDDISPDCTHLSSQAIPGCPPVTSGGTYTPISAGLPYNKATGYCEYTPGTNNTCASGGGKYNPLVNKCQDIPHCYNATTNVDYFTNIAPANTEEYKSKMVKQVACPNETLALSTNRNVYDKTSGSPIITTNEFCFRIHELINHKLQSSSSTITPTATTDWGETCGGRDTTDPFDDVTTANMANITGSYGGTSRANMILPNGAILYFNPSIAPFIIFVKYDRIDTVDAKAIPGKNLGAFRIDADGTFKELTPTSDKKGFQ